MKGTIIHDRGYRREVEIDEKIIATGGRIPCAYLQMTGSEFPNTWWLFDLNTGRGSEEDVKSWALDHLDLAKLRELATAKKMKVVPRLQKRMGKKPKVPKKPAPRQLSFGENT